VERPDGSLAFVPADGGGPTATARLQLARPRAHPRGVGGRECRACPASVCTLGKVFRGFEAHAPQPPACLRARGAWRTERRTMSRQERARMNDSRTRRVGVRAPDLLHTAPHPTLCWRLPAGAHAPGDSTFLLVA